MRLTKLTALAIQLNGALGSGRYSRIRIDQVKARIRDHSIMTYLESELGSDIDLSAVGIVEQKHLIDEWEMYANVVDERRKLAVEKNGLCLLVAYLLEGIRMRAREGGL